MPRKRVCSSSGMSLSLPPRRAVTLASASSIVRPTTSVPRRVRQMLAGSRSRRSQWLFSTSIRWRTAEGSPNTLHASPYWATMRSVFFSPLPPIRMGGPPACTGLGTLNASFTWNHLPSKVVV